MHQDLGLPDDLPPPPAYSEQEFDQKILTATDLSLQSVSSNQQVDEDGWEAYDADAFEAISNKLASMELQHGNGQGSSSGSSSRPNMSSTQQHSRRKSTEKVPLNSPGLPAVNPLRIEKKGAPNYDQSLDGSDPYSQAGPASKAVRRSPEPPPAFSAEPGPDESELNWSRPSSVALSPIDTQLFSAAQSTNPQPSHRQPDHQPEVAISGQPSVQPNLHHPLPQPAIQNPYDPQPTNQPQYSAQPPSNSTPTSPRPLPSTHNIRPNYQQHTSLPTNGSGGYQQSMSPSPANYQDLSPPQNPAFRHSFANIAPSPSGSPYIGPAYNAPSPTPSHSNLPQGYRNSVPLHTSANLQLNTRDIRHQSAVYTPPNDFGPSTPQPTRQSLPVAPRSQPYAPQPAYNNVNVTRVNNQPAAASLPFNPSLAYGNTFSQSTRPVSSIQYEQKITPMHNTPADIQYNAHALYNNAVSSHLAAFTSRSSAVAQNNNRMSTAYTNTPLQQPSLRVVDEPFNPYASQSIQGTMVSQAASTSPPLNTTGYWNTPSSNFQSQYNSNQNNWSGQQQPVNTMAQPHGANPQWYSYPSG